MSETDTDTTLCHKCQVPIEAPKPIMFGPFVAFHELPLWKDCELLVKIERFNTKHHARCPFQLPHWRPRP